MKIKFRLEIVTLILVCSLSFGSSAYAQGLKGLPNDAYDLSQTPSYLTGKSDTERWSFFLKEQKTLIGQTKAWVQQRFGQGSSYRNRNELSYKLTENSSPGTSEIAYLELNIIFRDSVVSAYSVNAVYWH